VENEVVIHVRAEDDTGPTFAAIRAKAKKFGEDVERSLNNDGRKSGKALADGIEDGVQKAGPRVKKKADDIGDAVVREMDSAGGKAGRELGDGIRDGLAGQTPGIVVAAEDLGAEVEEEAEKAGRRSGRKLGDGIGDGLKGVHVGAGFGERLAEFVARGSKKAGQAGGNALAQSLAGVMEAHPAITAAALGVGATVAPLLAANLGAAVVGTGGLLGIAGGFAASVKDPRVKSSLQSLKTTVLTDLTSAGKGFAPSALEGIDQVKKAWTDLVPTIRSVFSKSGDIMGPLIDGVLDGVAGLVEGIEESLDGAGPVMEAIGGLFRDLGTETGEIFSELEDNSADLAASVDLLSGVLGFLLDAITVVIEASATWIGQFPALWDSISGGAEITSNWVQELLGLKEATEGVSIEGGVWHDGITENTEAIEKQKDALQALSEEMQKQADPLYNLISAQSDVSDAQERYNEALKKHGPKSEEARDALVKLGKAVGNVSTAAGKAAESGFDGNLTPSMRRVMQQAGLSEGEIKALERALRNARGAADRWEGTFTQTYITNYKSMGLKSPSGGMGGFQGHASGGIAGAATGGVHSELRAVGEQGPELISLPPGSHVYSNPDSMAIAGRAGGDLGGRFGGPTAHSGDAATRVAFTFDPAGASKLIRAIMEMLRAEIRAEGGSVQKVLGTHGVG
jgi:hypothetical protein